MCAVDAGGHIMINSSSTLSTIILLLYCFLGALGESDGSSEQFEDAFKKELLERDLKGSIPVLEDKGVTSLLIMAKALPSSRRRIFLQYQSS